MLSLRNGFCQYFGLRRCRLAGRIRRWSPGHLCKFADKSIPVSPISSRIALSRGHLPPMFIIPIVIGRPNVFKLFLDAGHLSKRNLVSKCLHHGSLRGETTTITDREVPPFPRSMNQCPHLPLRLLGHLRWLALSPHQLPIDCLVGPRLIPSQDPSQP